MEENVYMSIADKELISKIYKKHLKLSCKKKKNHTPHFKMDKGLIWIDISPKKMY